MEKEIGYWGAKEERENNAILDGADYNFYNEWGIAWKEDSIKKLGKTPREVAYLRRSNILESHKNSALRKVLVNEEIGKGW